MENSKKSNQIYRVMTQEMYNSTPHPFADQLRSMNIPLDVPESLPISLNNVHSNMNGMADFLFKGSSIRIVVNGPTPDCTLFCGPDIAKILGYTHVPDMYRMLADYEKVVINISSVHNMHSIPNNTRHNETGILDNTPGNSSGIQSRGNPNVVFITLPGVFRLIANSRRPEALQFQNWVYHIVLPSIWTYGSYSSPATRERINNDHNLMYDINNKISELESKNTELLNKINDSEPYTNTGKFIIDNIQPINIEELAKILNSAGINIGRNRLFELLRKEGYLMKTGNDNRPTQKSLDLGLMIYNIIPLINGNVCKYLYVLPKGINYFINKYKDLS